MTTLAAQSLFQRIQSQDVAGAASLLQSGVINLDERDNIGQTFLMVACQIGCVEVVRLLLELPNVDVNAVDNDSWTALMNASKEGFLEIAMYLLDKGADLERKDIGGWTALTWACYKGRTMVVVELLNRGAYPNVRGEHNMSCLTWASGRGYTDIVKTLLACGAKPNTNDKYGTTPLMWSARKGHVQVVAMLLEEGATLDNAGMNSWTALIIAARGGYTDVVQLILEYGPNVNAVDKDSYTALTHAAKEGHIMIVNMLLEKEAYVNRPDRYGDTILIHATKGGHLEVVSALLRNHADVEIQGVDEKTALYWAVEKGHTTIVRLLLDHNASTEIPNKDGDTPLLKSVRSRNLEISKLLMDKGAKASSVDKKGDTALHIAVRGRSKRVTELLLRNPKDGRLLYRPNKSGETPYQIDSAHEKKILTQVFGARNLNADDNIEGYDLYSSTIADVLSEPSLNTPITVSLYAKWGSGKSFLIKKLIKEMKNFTQHNAAVMFEFSVLQFFMSFLMSSLVGVILALSVGWPIGLGVGLGIFVLQYLFLLTVWVGSLKRDWRWAYYLSMGLSRRLRACRLLMEVTFCNEPTVVSRETAAVKFLFTDNARLASVVGEKSITAMICTLCDSLEREYGTLVTRLYKVLRPSKASEEGRFKSLCCVPYFVIVIFVACCAIAVCALIYVYGFSEVFDSKITTADGIVIALLVIIGVALLGNIYTWACMLANLVVSPKKRVQKIMANSDSARIEGMIQNLKKEVELLGHMTRCMDAFLNKHTRLVVIVDGLDSCEQEKLLQVLDTVHMLFSDDKSPFITILAVDPHVIIKGIEHNLQGLFRDSSINGHDYLRNLVQLPFFLHGQTMPRARLSTLKSDVMATPSSGTLKDAPSEQEASQSTHRQESVVSGTSSVSIPDLHSVSSTKKKRSLAHMSATGTSYGSSNLARNASQTDLSKSLGKSSYFSDINPRNMKRMMNIIAVTGRLLRAYHVDFNWYKLASWINITEQWPYRLSWMLLELESNQDIQDSLPLKAVYDMISPKLPPSKDVDPRLEIDRNEHKLQVFLSSKNPLMTVGDLRRFMPCTINVDPYLRKLIKEQIQANESMAMEHGMGVFNPSMGNFDSYGWPLNMRRPSTRIDPSPVPRAGMSRSGSAVPMVSPVPGMFGPYGMYPMPGYTTPAPYLSPNASVVNMAGLNQTARASPKVNLQGGLPSDALSTMSVEDVCGVLYRLENINKSRLPLYINTFQEHNVSGPVLLTCDLPELKDVLGMTFGDWEVFRTLVLALRDQEQAASEDFKDGPQSPRLKFTGDAPPMEGKIHMPKPSYGMESVRVKRVLSEQARDSGSLAGDHHRTKPGLGFKKHGSFPGGRLLSRDGQSQYYTLEPPMESKISRKDSFFGEVMLESAALRSVVEAVGVTDMGEDTDEDVVKVMTPVPEEKLSPLKRRKSFQKESIKKRSDSKQEEDPRYKVNDSESGDSDSEVVLLSRKSSRKSPKNQKELTKLKAKSGSTVSLSSNSVPNTVNSSRSSTSLAKDYQKLPANPLLDQADAMSQETETIQLLGSKKGSYKKLSSADKNKDLNLYLGSDEEIIDVPNNMAMSKLDTPLTSANSEVERSFQNREKPDQVLVQANEHLALRNLSHTDNSVPSAFKAVTPTSSRASSRASSLGLSRASSIRGMSKDESMDTLRLSISESDPPYSSSRRSSQKVSPIFAAPSSEQINEGFLDGLELQGHISQEPLVETRSKAGHTSSDGDLLI